MLLSSFCAILCLQSGGGLGWPLGSGAQPFPLRATYGQVQGPEMSVDLHFGLDVLTSSSLQEGDSVRAMEAGTVVLAFTKSEYRSGLVIRSSVGRLLLYLHIDPTTMPFDEGDIGTSVPEGTYLGTVTTVDPDGLGRHVHVSVLEQLPSKWTGIDRASGSDPRKLLASHGDTRKPRALPFPDGRLLAVRTDEAVGTTTYAVNGHIQSGDLDVVVHLQDKDQSGSSHPLAPSKVELEIRSAGTLVDTFLLDFDQPLGDWNNYEEAFYNLDLPYRSCGWRSFGQYQYYFVLTNARGTNVDTANAWQATPGTYTLKVRAHDVAGKVLEFDEVLHVDP